MLHEIRVLIESRDERKKKFGRDYELIKLEANIRDNISSVDNLAKKLQETLIRYSRNPKKYPKNEIDKL